MTVQQFKGMPFYVKLASVLFSLIALVYIVIVAKEILSPLIFSCLFSILLLPFAAFLENKLRLPRSAASMLAVLSLLACIGGLLYVIGTQVSSLASDWPQFQDQLHKSQNDIMDWIRSSFHVTRHKQLTFVANTTDKVVASGGSVVGATLLSLSSILLFLVFTFIYTFFFLLYRKLIMRFLESVFGDENKLMVHDIIEKVQFIIRKYIIGLLIEMAIVATVVSVVFMMLGVKYAILLGLITGLFNIIPYIGIFTALIVSSAVTFATAPAQSTVIYVMITLVVTHLIDSNVLLPVIVGSKVRINALITVLGVIIGEMVWGIPGMFLSIPVIAVLKIIFDRVESLKPWGIILGDEEHKQNRLAKKVVVKDEPAETTE
ncbi:AI-2E family transporter [Mucilaginibacter sp. FT3.2]|uniref:AI-2E family transporter n=1 Tax=Mucilaginibacter sp. FT3.2 TaxID=2723090 RepID=UPI0017D0055D|nr:AI-2E family transporter [Mucilaginibacter sp. FT3.2]MBB6234411.1 putative PurR-regulated permease PerM [Mucilaginibacter sp. FT3.2]